MLISFTSQSQGLLTKPGTGIILLRSSHLSYDFAYHVYLKKKLSETKYQVYTPGQFFLFFCGSFFLHFLLNFPATHFPLSALGLLPNK